MPGAAVGLQNFRIGMRRGNSRPPGESPGVEERGGGGEVEKRGGGMIERGSGSGEGGNSHSLWNIIIIRRWEQGNRISEYAAV